MNSATIAFILCLAYIIGLLSTILPLPWGGIVVLILGIIATFFVPRFWRKGPKRWIWLVAGLVGLAATLYFQVRIPRPPTNDISRETGAMEQLVTVRGTVESMPRLTRTRKAQFWLEATQLNEIIGKDRPVQLGKEVSGKLYVTVPLLQATGLHTDQRIAVMGRLYKPKLVSNPGGFDFRNYLAQEGAFAGLAGQKVEFLTEEQGAKIGWWAIRQRIIRSHTLGLGVPEGPLVSAMVLGSQSVNFYLPVELKDQFTRIGLAHTLAASGFQVSLILYVVLLLTKGLSVRSQFIAGVIALGIFLALTGPQPPILRAVVMGVAALIAPLLQRKINPIGSLLLAATFLLLLNPTWIWDLSFQLSFLATLGLVVTVPAISKRLDWMPPVLAAAIAIPVAASIWTLPLQLYVFKIISPYSIPINIITTPFVTILSIGGFISAILGVLWPIAGGRIAWLLYYPTHWLIGLVEFFYELPGNSVAVGAISQYQLLVLYILIALVCLFRWWRNYWWFAGLLAATVIVIPVWQTQTALFQATILEAGKQPVLVIQDKGKVTLVNSGDSSTGKYDIIPFLQHQGVNQVDWAIATNTTNDNKSGWLTILGYLPIANFYSNSSAENGTPGQTEIQKVLQARKGNYQPLIPGQIMTFGTTSVRLINAEVPMLQLLIDGQNWLFIGALKSEEQKQLLITEKFPKVDVLWTSGERVTAELLKVVQPKVVIVSADKVDLETLANVNQAKINLFITGKDGAVQWKPSGKFETSLELTEGYNALL
ncbi:ComEC/Rec2 family competence protein [Floridanema evergladense]|uniref:ComEC/Rec2 family competence protein n=1 Tax=Floridaenema evergladense BLCC-F167 TaxID=3153639 RepID=A0ABV4WTM1_9CYAN